MQPLSYATARLKDRQFCPLWYFTKEGCAEAASQNMGGSEVAFGLLSSGNNGISLKASETVRQSKRALLDKDLSWQQIMIGKALLIEQMKLTGWEEAAVLSYAMLYFNLDNHPWRAVEDGEEALIRFHHNQRKLWHAKLSSILEGHNAGPIWDISIIRIDGLNQCMSEVKSEKTMALAAKVSTPLLSCFKLPQRGEILSSKFFIY